MKREDMIEDMIKFSKSTPQEASDYHRFDMLLGYMERRGILPPCGCTDDGEWGNGCLNFEHNNSWEDDEA